jgi:hypothetical protein
MKNTKFSILGEKVDFDHNGDPIASYDLMNWRREQDGSLRLLKVGFYDASLSPELSLVVNESAIQWPVGQQVCSRQIPSRPPLPLRLFCVHLINAFGNLLILILKLLDVLFVHLQRSFQESPKIKNEVNNKDLYPLYIMHHVFFNKLPATSQQFS